MKKKLVLLGACALLAVASASAQKRVTGRVVDSQGNPVVGATIKVTGAKVVTRTDANGTFVLANVPSSAKTLDVTYIGLKSENVSISSNVNVVMKDNALAEAVVVGYGTARKIGTIGGAVTKVSGEDIEATPSINVMDAMQGKVAGLQVYNNTGDVGDLSNTSIVIRGVGSLEAGNTPLIVVDGSPADASILNLLNPSDIESMITLKDASATSIYGSRAANGVIYITTKSGRKGEKAVVTIGQKIGWSQLARSVGNPMNATELLDFQLANGIITSEQYNEYKSHGANTDWQKYHFRNDAPMYETDFSVRGGSQSTDYFVSGNYMKNTGVDDASHMKRYNFRTNLRTQVNDWMQMGVNQAIVYTDRLSNGYTKSGSNNIRSYSTAAYMYPAYWDPYAPGYAENHMIYGMNSYDTKWLASLYGTAANDIIYNGSAFIQLQPVKGLTLKSQLGLYATNTNYKQTMSTEFPGNNGIAEAYLSDSRSAQWTITNTAEYKADINENNELTFLVGQEGIRYTSKGFSVGAKGSTDDRLLMLSNMTEDIWGDISESKTEYQFLSFFGRVDYALNKRYFLNFTVRNDQSSRFGATNRSAMFYSGSANWNIKREKFMDNLWWLTDADLRFSVGSTGNSSIGNYDHLGLVGTTQYNGAAGWGLAQPANTELGWESQIQTNVGFNATIFDRFTVEFNWYNRKTKDMLMSIPLPTTTGFSAQMMNVGELTNRGVELTANYDIIKPKKQGDLWLNFRMTYGYNTNEITKLFYGIEEWPMESYLLCYKVGESLNFYMPIYAGVDKEDGAPMWYKKGHKGGVVHEFNPETMTKDASNMSALNQDTGKSQYAPHTGGFGLSASWKGFSLVADFAFTLKKYMVNNVYLWATDKGSLQSGYNADRDVLGMWQKPGDIATLPGFQYSTQFDTHLLENASFLRLKNLTIAYDLPKKWMEATKFMQGARLSFTTRNLFTVTKYKGPDPEINTNISYGNYPATRQFVLGVEVTF